MKQKSTIIIGADHAGFGLKEKLKKWLSGEGYEVLDFGASRMNTKDDYPDYIIPVAEAVSASDGLAIGIVLGGSGIGECIAANKVRGVRAAVVYDVYTARMARQDNDANVICFGGRTAPGKFSAAKKLLGIFLKTRFSGAARHKRRLKKISDYEQHAS